MLKGNRFLSSTFSRADCFAAFGMNKDRLYMALYIRNAREGDVRYHTALLRIPKGTGLGDISPSAYCYHAVNDIVDGKEVWVYKALPTRPLSVKLRALLFLGKMEISASDLEQTLKQVPVVQDNPNWRCHDWIWAAMKLLAEKGIIDPLPRQPQDLWHAAITFADENSIVDGLVPTCATDGERIKSAFEGL
ncbi:hypothetical protein D9615_010037 [Tricholomella constricta]|uniref:Uncharacterized protein n=1 Tax=Tricholomella constricta TaxID=117010 RepID=A0A8H5GTZ1_9AGAR|nr:hypothetical protein D9615_010037 [Tricholomella constricta]